MPKKYTWLAMILLLSVLAIPSIAHADDSMNVDIDIWGDNPDTWVDIWGINPDVWINGKHLSNYGKYWANYYSSKAMRSSVPNGRYSGASSPGWQGYFGIYSNDVVLVIDHINPGKVSYSVYQGAGCGGKYGVNDGWPDFWSRRQLLGLLPILESHYRHILSLEKEAEELNTRIKNLETDFDKRITANYSTLEAQSQDMTSLSIVAKEGNSTDVSMRQEIAGLRTGIIILGIVVAMLVLAMIAILFLGLRSRE